MSRLVYKRSLKKEDFIDFKEQIMFFKDNNIAYITIIMREYVKIFLKHFQNFQLSHFMRI